MIEIDSILDVENHISDVDAVIFDLDDTLYSEKEYVKSGFKQVASLFPDISEMQSELWNSFLRKEQAIDIVLKKFNLLSYKEQALNLYRSHIPTISLYDGVSEMLKRIKVEKKVGIITDGHPDGQRKKINALGILVDEIIITDELGGIEYRKPNDTAFKIISQRFCLPYESMVYIGDNKSKDFIAPFYFGMKCIFFNNSDGIYYNIMERKK